MGLGGHRPYSAAHLGLLGVKTEQGFFLPLPEGGDSPSTLSWGRAGVTVVRRSTPTYVSHGELLQWCPWSCRSLAKPR